MRVLIILFIASLIITKSVSKPPVCDVRTSKQALLPRTHFEQTIDGRGQPVLVTRFFHNKIGFLGSEFGRCYFNIFDLNYLAKNIGLVGLIFWLYFLYQIVNMRKWLLVSMFLLIPLLPFFDLFPIIIPYSYKIIAITGGILFIFARKKTVESDSTDECERIHTFED
ncbi:hypothetical protein A2164_00675 [Candidatus Curtissbacteria bacterium RBG_13_35_7]|uniref:Glycosyltransferase RgtA/B/C/D-like domain-containing protein n=1 Tax=Candidatus Curtissbacteria bacterium RBG_13_35_7 TaxID=1797705 RepID=A0A1F5G358_9BACT|nr:MAG: hypothetical protein A2164_00675 [Candidatus Curtissbacteria bacterium RBG_13_35_7]